MIAALTGLGSSWRVSLDTGQGVCCWTYSPTNDSIVPCPPMASPGPIKATSRLNSLNVSTQSCSMW